MNVKTYPSSAVRPVDAGSGLLIALGLVAVVTGLRAIVLYLTPMQLFFDEAQYWSWGTALDFGYFSKPPLLAFIIRGFTEICGDGEACVRLASPVLYGLTALVAGLLARRIAPRMGGASGAALIWTAMLFATLPGVSFATRLISTDAALLLCFALALLFLDRLRERASAANALGLGLAIGFGFMAKYAMVYCLGSALLWVLISREGRRTLLQPVLLLTPLVAGIVVLPNILWNARHQWITFQHTRENGNWQGLRLHFDNLAEFAGAQIGIIGPVLFVVLLIGLWRGRKRLSDDAIFLLCFSLPVLAAMCVQATVARAHANWAAVAFVPLTVLAVSWAVSWRAKTPLVLALAIHLVVLAGLAASDIKADILVETRIGYPYKRVFGWREFAEAVRQQAEAAGAKTIVAGGRDETAELLYYLRDSDLAVRTWSPDGLPGNHYEMTIPLAASDPGPVLVLSACAAKGGAGEALPVIDIAVRPRFSIRTMPYLATAVGLQAIDYC